MNCCTDCDYTHPLGMITGKIEDWQITSSSVYPVEWDSGCDERHGRVYQPDGLGWCAKYKSASEWIQIDLGVPAKVSHFHTHTFWALLICFLNQLLLTLVLFACSNLYSLVIHIHWTHADAQRALRYTVFKELAMENSKQLLTVECYLQLVCTHSPLVNSTACWRWIPLQASVSGR